MSGRILSHLVRLQHAVMYRHVLDSVSDAAAQVGGLEVRAYFVPCKLAQYDRWVDEGIDITSLPQAEPYDGQTGNGTIVFWTTLNRKRVACTAVSAQWIETVYAKVLPALSETPPAETVFEGLIYTSPPFRRKGVAALQQSFARRVLAEHGYREMLVYVAAENEASRRLQESAGAVVAAEGCLVEFPTFVRSSLRVCLWVANRHLAQALRRLTH